MGRKEIVHNAYNQLRLKGIVHTQKDFANLLGINQASVSKAMNGDEKYLTNNLMEKIQQLLSEGKSAVDAEAVSMFTALDEPATSKKNEDTLLVIPTGARAGTLGDFAAGIHEYDCEKMVSPIKGADYAIQVTGDSMSPEYPNGSLVIIKQIDEEAFVEWGKVYVLDTPNGAVLKQIRKTDDRSIVECVSLNEAYQPFEINVKYIKGWYRVLMVLSLK